MKTLSKKLPAAPPTCVGATAKSHFLYSLFTLSKIELGPWPHGQAGNYSFSRSLLFRVSPGDLMAAWRRRLVEVNGIEPMTSCLQSRRSPN